MRRPILALLLLTGVVFGQSGFELIATYKGVGGVQDELVGPGPDAGSQRYYVSYIYLNNTFHIVGIDPATGRHEVYPNPTKTEWSVKQMVVGTDGNIYMGTVPGARFLRLNPRTKEFVDLGRPASSESYIWRVTVGSDGKIYGCTYPSAKLVRYDPVTKQVEDLGRMDPVEQYARTVVASKDGFIYTGVGYAKAHLVAYEIATGKHRDILPAEFQVLGAAQVHEGSDGRLYAEASKQAFRLEGWNAVRILASEMPKATPVNQLADGRLITTTEGKIKIADPQGGQVKEFLYAYSGAEFPFFRVAMGPDRMIYGSTVLPIRFVRVSPKNGRMKDFGLLGGGEYYSFMPFDKLLVGAAYSGLSPLMSYDPRKAFKPGEPPGSNPLLVKYEGQAPDWRPQAMIRGPGSKVYIGAVAGYGKLGGPLTVWDPVTNRVESFDVVKNQAVVTLTIAGDLIVGATSIGGGGGSHSTEKEAKLFLWDPKSKANVFETVPVSGAAAITDLVTAPNGKVYGIAGRGMLFCFDPVSRKVIHTARLPFSGFPYNSVGVSPDGKIWGLTGSGIFSIDPSNHDASLQAKSPKRITAGFALDRDSIYFVSEWDLYRYRIPKNK